MTIKPETLGKIDKLWEDLRKARKTARAPQIGLVGIAIMVIGLWLSAQKIVTPTVATVIIIVGALFIIPVEVIRYKAKVRIINGYKAIAEETAKIMEEVENPALCDEFNINIGSRTTNTFSSREDICDINDIIAIDLSGKYFRNVIYKGEQAWLYCNRYNEPERYVRVSVVDGVVAIQGWLVDMGNTELNLSGQSLKMYKKVHRELLEHLQEKILTFDGTFEE